MSSTDPGAIAIYVAERDIADVAVALGAQYCSVEAVQGFLSGGVNGYAIAQPPGTLGVVVTSPYASSDAGQVSFTVRVTSSTYAITASVIRQLAAWCTQGDLALSSSLAPGVSTFVRATDAVLIGDEVYNKTGTLSITYSIAVPVWWEAQPTTVVIPGNALRMRCPMGSADVNPFIRVFGPSTGTITGTLRDHRGASIATFTLSALTSSDVVLIDTNRLTVQKVASGVVGTVADGYALFTGEYIVLASVDADRYASVGPTIELDDSGHTASAELLYYKGWR